MEKYPKEFYCPITQEIMTDPVIGPDGQSYERESIEGWLDVHSVSPLTRQPMSKTQLIPNFALKNAIEELVHGISEPAPEPSPPPEKFIETNLKLEGEMIREDSEKGILHLSVVPPAGTKRTPTAFICLVDSSGSMNSSANIQSTTEANSFSVLDLIIHSMKTIVHMLTEEDFLCIISFSDAAKVVVPLQRMNAFGKSAASRRLDTIEPGMSTNIWDALREAMNTIKTEQACDALNTVVWLFTDGVPNINPPRGIVPTLKTFLTMIEQPFTLHTFGFGYDLDSNLLISLAQLGKGINCYLPDCNLVGTTFINCLCNSLTTAVRKASIQVISDTAESLQCVGYPMENGIEERDEPTKC